MSLQRNEHHEPSEGSDKLPYEDSWAPCHLCDGYFFNKIRSNFETQHTLNPLNQARHHEISVRALDQLREKFNNTRFDRQLPPNSTGERRARLGFLGRVRDDRLYNPREGEVEDEDYNQLVSLLIYVHLFPSH